MDKSLFSELMSGDRLGYAPIAASTQGATEIIPALAGKRYRVLAYVLAAAGACTVKFTDTTGDLAGPFPIAAAGDGLDPGLSPIGHFRTRRGEPLNIVLSAAVAVGGHLCYALD